jgi:hypothetical protein
MLRSHDTEELKEKQSRQMAVSRVLATPDLDKDRGFMKAVVALPRLNSTELSIRVIRRPRVEAAP